MKLTSFEAIVRALNADAVHYLVAGGLAVNAHGYSRFTNDVDLVVQLTESDISKTFYALEKLGYKPSVPVTAEEFSKPEQRKLMIETKRMTVLQMWSDEHKETPVDIFVIEPFDFAKEYQSAFVDQLSPEVSVRFVSIETLIEMKKKVRRPEDLADIEHLTTIASLKQRKKL
jgi:hypothetical protein